MKKKTAKKEMDYRFAAVMFLFLFIFLGQFYCFAWSSTMHRDLGYAITNLSAEYKDLLAKQKNLKIEVAVLKAPQRIERIAKAKMGLKSPSQNQIITIR